MAGAPHASLRVFFDHCIYLCQVLQSYLTLLEGDDPNLAQRITWDENGDLVIEPPLQAAVDSVTVTVAAEDLEPGTVQLLEWDQPRGLD